MMKRFPDSYLRHGPIYALYCTVLSDMLFNTLDRDVFNEINFIKNSFNVCQGRYMLLFLEPEAGRLRGWECYYVKVIIAVIL